ncbi:IclR family transcriptional regulator [Tsukamurella spumae]|uniref:IclR family transcriptional regulator n=1 Tax=Tsukamurella spumae TaxID=44753 RepID=A0A846X734_9ACTN|nr:IclR family transcriptional regulator [Tsukamurella spumae]NKY19580.1 IclR family transcriptional regulator [Tsukamurella spumae]
MQKRPAEMIRRPEYAPRSVDNALRLLQILRDTGALRITDAAREIGVAPSTAHRLLAALVYRGFAVQDEAHLYRPGPAIGARPAEHGRYRAFVELCRPHIERLCATVGETVNLIVLVGDEARFLWTVEASALLRIGDRQGQVLPAEITAGGQILLADLPDDELARRYEASDVDLEGLRKELAAARRVGFALNVERTERGVSAIAMAVRDATGTAIASVAVAMPSVRYRARMRADVLARAREAVQAIEAQVAHGTTPLELPDSG